MFLIILYTQCLHWKCSYSCLQSFSLLFSSGLFHLSSIISSCLFCLFFSFHCLPPVLICSLSALRDRLRTTTNVLGDSIGAGIVEHLSRNELQNKDAELGNSVVEEADKKPYQLICQENEYENERHPDSETKM